MTISLVGMIIALVGIIISLVGMIAAFVGIILGVPGGIALGRWLWDLFARVIYAVPRPSVPALEVLVVVGVTIVLANLVAALPGRMAARTATALVLRAE